MATEIQPARAAQAGIVDVAAGLLIGPDGRLLLGQRPEGKPYAGWWELPGGKLEPGETFLQALARELREELGIEITEAQSWVTLVHAYAHATVRLVFCRVTGWRGEPAGLEGQRLRWVDPDQEVAGIEAGLGGGQLLPATVPPLEWLRVPTTYAIADATAFADVPTFVESVARALGGGTRLFQFRAVAGAADDARLYQALQAMLRLTRPAGARVLVNSRHPEAWWREADGVHLRSGDLSRPLPDLAPRWIGASAHNAGELAQARAAGARFVVLGPVLPTASHPDAPVLGWAGFAGLAAEAGLPVFALGGQSPETLPRATAHGAHGVAGIRAFF